MNWFQRKFSSSNSSQLFQNLPDQALQSLDQATQTADNLIHRAHQRANSGDMLGALTDLDEAIQCNPARATAYFNRGFLHNTLGNFEAAIQDFNQAQEFLPDYDEVYYQRGVSSFHLKDLDQALQDFNYAIQLNAFSIKSYYKRAEIYAEYGDVSSVLEDYAHVLDKIPKDANAYHHRGVFLAKIGELNAAIADFSSAIANNPQHTDAYCSRGCCYAQLGQLDSAQQDFNQALLHNPSSQAGYYQQIYGLKTSLADTDINPVRLPPPQDLPQLPAATESYRSAIDEEAPDLSMSGDTSYLHQYFERANQKAIGGDSEGAIADYTKILELDPENTQAYYHRGQHLSTLGYQTEALEDLDEAIHWAKVHSLGLLRDFGGALSDTLETLKTDVNPPQSSLTTPTEKPPIEATIEDCSQRIHANPKDANAYFRRGQSRALKGDLQGAIADYTETLHLDPHHAEAHYRRALSHSALGNKTAATYDLQRAILYKPAIALEDGFTSAHADLLDTTHPLSLPHQSLNQPLLHLATLQDCDHANNAPDNHFCVYCGQALSKE